MPRNNLILIAVIGFAAWLYFSDRPDDSDPDPPRPDSDLAEIAADALEGRESDGWFYSALYGRLADRAEDGAFDSRGELIDTTLAARKLSGVEKIGEEFGEAAFGDLGGPGPVDESVIDALEEASQATRGVASGY